MTEPSAAREVALSAQTESYPKGTEIKVEPAATSRDAARASLKSDLAGDVFVRKSHCFTMVRATETALAKAGDDKERVDALVKFLAQYGSAFTDNAAAPLSEEIDLEVFRPGIQVEEGGAESVHVLLRQRVSGFAFADSVVGGKYVGSDLVQVAGCLVDPATSAPRVKSLAISDAASALAAFDAALGSAETAGGTVIGRFSARNGEVEWTLFEHRLDAVTGAYLGKVAPPTGDPMTPTQSVGQ